MAQGCPCDVPVHNLIGEGRAGRAARNLPKTDWRAGKEIMLTCEDLSKIPLVHVSHFTRKAPAHSAMFVGLPPQLTRGKGAGVGRRTHREPGRKTRGNRVHPVVAGEGGGEAGTTSRR